MWLTAFLNNFETHKWLNKHICIGQLIPKHEQSSFFAHMPSTLQWTQGSYYKRRCLRLYNGHRAVTTKEGAFDSTVDTGQLLQKKVLSTLQWTQGSYYKRRCLRLCSEHRAVTAKEGAHIWHICLRISKMHPSPFPQSRPLMCLLKRFPTWSWHLKKRQHERGPSSIRRTVSYATLGKPLRDGAELIWAFPST